MRNSIRVITIFLLLTVALGVEIHPSMALTKMEKRLTNKEDIPKLMMKLKTAKGHSGHEAARELAWAFYEPGVIEGFIEILEGDNDTAKSAVGAACERGYHPPVEILPSLIAALDTDDDHARGSLVRGIGSYGEEAVEAVPSLIKLLDDDEAHVRMQAADTIGKIGPVAKACIPALIENLDDNGRSCADAAAYALGAMGATAKVALPDLTRTIYDTWTPSSYEPIQDVFYQIGPDSIPYLNELLHSGNYSKSDYARKTLKKFEE